MRYFSYDETCGFEIHATLEEAKAACEAALADKRVEAVDGWSEAVHDICYGKITGGTFECDKRPAPEGSGLDYICDYRLGDEPDDEAGGGPER